MEIIATEEDNTTNEEKQIRQIQELVELAKDTIKKKKSYVLILQREDTEDKNGFMVDTKIAIGYTNKAKAVMMMTDLAEKCTAQALRMLN